ncbi:MAG TPA: Gfo/Idh/MocA family oxidoreductase [Planctomycetota bacterium]|nr:Gfo/Idh/MocA family oxidoreductase [Planctomycetota bacterium]
MAVLRVAMLSGWHVHAKGYANTVNSFPDAKVTVVWDEEPARGKAWAEELKVPFEADLRKCCERDDVDGVVVDAPTSMHPGVMIAAAKAGKHIFTEKVMALTVKDCDRISAAVRKAGVRFCISMPQRTSATSLFAKSVLDEGLLGDVTVLRVRVAHNGASAGWLPPHFYVPETCGGGAMMDLGAHPMYLARWILGKPSRIVSTFNDRTGHVVEDNSVCLIEFESKAIAVVETSFVSSHSPGMLELYGTEGSLLIGGPEGRVQLRSNKVASSVPGWVAPAELPKPLPAPLRQWVSGILEGAPIHFGLEDGTQLTELMEAAYRSHRTGRQVTLA